jgi:hypothetical protein
VATTKTKPKAKKPAKKTTSRKPKIKLTTTNSTEYGTFKVGKYEGYYTYSEQLGNCSVKIFLSDLEYTAYRDVLYRDRLPDAILDAVRAITLDKNLS